MLSGNEHSHDERLTADDADGKTDFLAGVGLKNVRENKKTPIGEKIRSLTPPRMPFGTWWFLSYKESYISKESISPATSPYGYSSRRKIKLLSLIIFS